MAIQADGKIVVVGTAGRAKFALARYNSDGTLDASFGVNGKVMTDFTHGGRLAYGVAIQADGRIVVVGQRGPTATEVRTKFALARYNSDGTLDATFGGDGKVMTGFTSGCDRANGVAIQADGKIVAVGTARADLRHKFALARYNSDGTLDATFGGDGKVMTDFTAGWDGASGVAIQADGRIVAAGAPGNGMRTRSSPSPATTATAPSTRASAPTARSRPTSPREATGPLASPFKPTGGSSPPAWANSGRPR